MLEGLNALVTGGTRGLGGEIAKELAVRGCVVRKVGKTDNFPYDINCERIDVLVNCAGVHEAKPIIKCNECDFDRVINVNVKAPFYLMKKVLPNMIHRGWGRIVNIGSTSAYNGFVNNSLYCMSKHSLLGLSRALYEEYRANGIRVYCISPSTADTDMGRKFTDQEYYTFIDPKEFARLVVETISYDGNMVTPEIIAERIFK